MSLNEMYDSTPIELDECLKCYYRDRREDWERTRLQTFILFNAQGGSEDIKTVKDLMSFPWDEEDEEAVPVIDFEAYDKKYRG
jgi:hypothetical protein